jgi:hypothetical protein
MKSWLIPILVALIVTHSSSWFSQTPSDSSAINKALQRELLEMTEADQKYRVAWQARWIEMSPAQRMAPDQEFVELTKKIEEIDKKNLARLDQIITKHGWPGRSLVGEKAAQGAWLIIQHAGLSTQQRYLPLVKQAASKGEALPADAATLEDRVLMGEGKKQIYGTQVRFGPDTGGKLELYPIEDEENVDIRRAAVGLEPIAEYLKAFGLEYKPPKRR